MPNLNYNSYYDIEDFFNNQLDNNIVLEEIVFHDYEELVSFTLPFIVNRNLKKALFESIKVAILKLPKEDQKNSIKEIKNWIDNKTDITSFLTVPMTIYNEMIELKEQYEH
ncbi:MAG: hypothetical protein ACOC2W_00165 [bacterium]